MKKYIELATGVRAKLCGKVELEFRIVESAQEPRGGYFDYNTFYILENLTSDVLLGEDLLDEIRAYEELSDLFVELLELSGVLPSEVNCIKWAREMERKWLQSRLRNARSGPETVVA